MTSWLFLKLNNQLQFKEQGTNVTSEAWPLRFLSAMVFSSDTHMARQNQHVSLTWQGLQQHPHRCFPGTGRDLGGRGGFHVTVRTMHVYRTCLQRVLGPATSKELHKSQAGKESQARRQLYIKDWPTCSQVQGWQGTHGCHQGAERKSGRGSMLSKCSADTDYRSYGVTGNCASNTSWVSTFFVHMRRCKIWLSDVLSSVGRRDRKRIREEICKVWK